MHFSPPAALSGGNEKRVNLGERPKSRLADGLRFERLDRRAVEDRAAELEARAVAGAVPGPVGLVPADQAAHMRAGGGDGVKPALLVAEGGDSLAVYLEDRGVARRQLGEAFRLARHIAADEVGGDLGIAPGELLAAGDRLDAGRVVEPEPGIVAAGDEVGQDHGGRRAVADPP